MCGICGITVPPGGDSRESVPVVRRMMSCLEHRGPDDHGMYECDQVVLGHRRLSIVDPTGGRQPIHNEERSLWICANGEIYNHPDLSTQLCSQGHRYSTASDSETIAHLYEDLGADVFGELRGMFAVALWDERRRRLLLGRDRLGIKPLYYSIDDEGRLGFASEIKALLASGLVPTALRVEAVPELLANRFVAGSRTLFRDIRELPPGHFLLWEDGRVRVESYWELRDPLFQTDGNESGVSLSESFDSSLSDAVRSHLMSDVPVGVLLSGGLDSTTIAAYMARERENVSSFSVGFDGEPESELSYAELAAEHLGTNHYSVQVSPEKFFDCVPDLVWHQDTPLPWPSCVPLYFVCELAGEHVKVVLTGEGSDELLAGYGRYGWTLWNRKWGRRHNRLPSTVRRATTSFARGIADTVPTLEKLRRTFLLRAPDIRSLYFDNFGVFSESSLSSLFSPALSEMLRQRDSDPYALDHVYWAESDGADLLSRLLYVDCRTYLTELLMKQDRMSMAASIESRVPFLDNEMIDLAFRLPDRAKMEGRTGKRILRETVKDLVPDSILHRPKEGFPTPVGKWLATEAWEQVEDLVLGEDRVTRPLFDDEAVRALARTHRSREEDCTEDLWLLLNLEHWARVFDVEIGI